MLEKMSREQEDKIVAAVEGLLARTRSAPGIDVTSEIVKIATAEAFTAPVVERLVEAYNVARSTVHFKTAADKTSVFPLADAAVALDAMYPSDVETAEKQAAVRENVVKRCAPPVEKEAAVAIPSDPAFILRRIEGEVLGMEKLADDTRRCAAALDDALVGKLNDIRFALNGLPPADIDDIEYACRGCYGVEKVAVVLSAVRRRGTAYGIKKAAGVMCVDTRTQPFRDIAIALDLVDSVADAKVMADLVKAAAAECREALGDFRKAVFEKRAVDPATKAVIGAAKDLGKVNTAPYADKIGNSPFSVAKWMGEAKPATKSLEWNLGKLDIPAMRAKNDALASQVVLFDMVNNDPVLRHAELADIVDAFNDIVSIAPNIISNTGALRAALREHVSSKGMGAFEVKNVTDTGKAYEEAVTKPRLQELATLGSIFGGKA